MRLSATLKIIPLLITGYLFAWCFAYAFTMLSRGDQPSWREGYEYFILAWTFRAGELPGFIWLLSLVVFALLAGVLTLVRVKHGKRQ